MYYTHHFAHQGTLRRAHTWLVSFGFRPEPIETEHGGAPWLGLAVDSGRVSLVELVVNAVERSDPRGWPSFWDEAGPHHASTAAPALTAPAHEHPRPSTIGWHPIDTARPGPEFQRFADAMGR